MINTVFFDLGNTLLWNSHTISIESAVHALAGEIISLGYPVSAEKLSEKYFAKLSDYYRRRDIDYLETDVHGILTESLKDSGVAEISKENMDKGLDAFYAMTQKNWHLTDQAENILEQLKKRGLKLGIITNASSSRDVYSLLENHHLKPFFQSVTISSAAGYRKPRKEIFDMALSKMNSLPGESAMVGDSISADITGANRSGLLSIWFSQYSTEKPEDFPESSRPQKTIHCISELPEVL